MSPDLLLGAVFGVMIGCSVGFVIGCWWGSRPASE